MATPLQREIADAHRRAEAKRLISDALRTLTASDRRMVLCDVFVELGYENLEAPAAEQHEQHDDQDHEPDSA